MVTGAGPKRRQQPSPFGAFGSFGRLRLVRARLCVRGRGGNRRRVTLALRGHGMVAAMRMALAASAFFFDVDDFPGAADVTVTPDDASTG
jgi:hypothetical protein